ncbi:MAG: hypothetical protein ABEJ56_05810 [Candidatus Nanohaloarchaea archaeon]
MKDETSPHRHQLEQALRRELEEKRRQIKRIQWMYGFTLIGISAISIMLGYNLGITYGKLPADTSQIEEFSSNGFTTAVVPDNYSIVSGNTVGSTVSGIDDKIYVEKDLPPYLMYRTCVHERLHERGVMSDEDHKWVNKMEERVVDPYCIRLVAAQSD